MAYLWKPGKITGIKVANALQSVTTTADLSTNISGTTQTYENLQAYMKNVTVAIPSSAVDKVDLLGVDSDGFQNAVLEDKPFENGGISGTMVLHDVSVLESFYYGDGTTVAGILTGTTYRPGLLNGTGRKDTAIIMTLDNSLSSTNHKKINVLLNNARMTKLGDVKISGPDSHFEVDFEAVCLPKDFYFQILRG